MERTGQGTMTYPDGTKKEGIWKDDEYQDAKMDQHQKTTIQMMMNYCLLHQAQVLQ